MLQTSESFDGGLGKNLLLARAMNEEGREHVEREAGKEEERKRLWQETQRQRWLHAFAVRDLVREQQVDLMWCPTDENPSDLLTKAIASPSKFEKFQSVLLGECEMKKEVVAQEALAVKDKNGVAHCFLVRRRGGD